ncbi:MAG: DUF4402 domain-containing protein [Sphingomicrobium sp.]
MSRIALLAVGLAATALSLAPATPAAGQCRLCDNPTTAVPLDADRAEVDLQVETRLDFDALVMLGTGEGTATLRPDGSRIATGMVGDISGRAMVGSATVRGEPGRTIRIGMPHTIAMHSLRGGQVTMDEIVTDLPSLPRLDSGGNLSFRFGGRLKVTGDAEGDYRGDVPITVEYL